VEFTPLVTQNVRFWQIALKKSACGQNASQRLSGVVEILGPYVAGTSVVTGINPLEVGLTVPINSAARGWARSIGPVSPRNYHRSPQCSTESTNPAVALEVTERHAPQIPPPSSVDDRITTALTDAAGRFRSPNCVGSAVSEPPASTSDWPP